MALVDLKSNLANFRSNFVTPGVEKKNALEASVLNIDTVPSVYSGKTKFTKPFIDTSAFDRADKFISRYSGITKFTPKYTDVNSKFNKDGINIKFSPTGVYLPEQFTTAKINSSKFNIDNNPSKFSPSGIYLPELFTTAKINSSRFNIDTTPDKFSPNTKYLPTRYYPESKIKLTATRWSRKIPPAVNFINDNASNSKGFTINLGKPGRLPNPISGDQSQFLSFVYTKKIFTSNGDTSLTNQLGKGSPFRDFQGTAQWLPGPHRGFFAKNKYEDAVKAVILDGKPKQGFLAATFKPNGNLQSIDMDNSQFQMGSARFLRQLGDGTLRLVKNYESGTEYDWFTPTTAFDKGKAEPHRGFHKNNRYLPKGIKFKGFLAATYNTNSPIDELYKKYHLQEEAHNPTYMPQPYVVRGLQRKGKESPQRWGFGLNFDDGLIRGGAVTAVERAAMDSVRIAKWMASPKGLLWIVKQVGLGLTNPKVESIGGPLTRQTRIHTGITSLLSVAGSAFGLHFTRHGLPFANEVASYENVQRANKFIRKNRLESLRDELFNTNSFKAITGIRNFTSKFKGAEIKSLSDNFGGPNSVYGLGGTTIRRHTDSRIDNDGKFLSSDYDAYSNYAADSSTADRASGAAPVFSITSLGDEKSKKVKLYKKWDESVTGKYTVLNPPDSGSPLLDKFGISPGQPPTVIAPPVNVYKPTSIKDAEGKALVQSKKFTPTFAKARTEHTLDNTSNLTLTQYDDASQIKTEISKFEKTTQTTQQAGTETLKSITPGAKTSKNDSVDRSIETYESKQKSGYPAVNQYIDINKYITLAYNKIPKSIGITGKKFNDFREDIVNSGNTLYPEDKGLIGYRGADYFKNNNLEGKYGFGELGKVGIDRSNPNEFIVKADMQPGDLSYGKKTERFGIINNPGFRGDKITAINVVNETLEKSEIYPDGASDLIKFFFEDGNKGINVMPFRCTLISLSDSFQPGWEQISIMGRPDGAYLYTSFERSISFSFKVAALSRSEMFPMWRKLNRLATYTMPDFDGKNGRPSGPFMRISIGNLFQRTPGFITSLTYSIPDDATWDIGEDIDLTKNPTPKQLPMVVEASVNFTIVGDFRPQLNGRVYSLEPLGGQRNDVGDWLRDAKITSPVIVPAPPPKPPTPAPNPVPVFRLTDPLISPAQESTGRFTPGTTPLTRTSDGRLIPDPNFQPDVVPIAQRSGIVINTQTPGAIR